MSLCGNRGRALKQRLDGTLACLNGVVLSRDFATALGQIAPQPGVAICPGHCVREFNRRVAHEHVLPGCDLHALKGDRGADHGKPATQALSDLAFHSSPKSQGGDHYPGRIQIRFDVRHSAMNLDRVDLHQFFGRTGANDMESHARQK